MSEIENPRTCSKCALPALRKQGNQWLCARHYRFGQMRASAKRHGKIVPTHDQLENIATLWCGDCGCGMNWLGMENQTTVVTLQHYRDGTFGMVCRSCNTRHARMDGDSYRTMPKDHKQCPQCKDVKPLSMFSVDNGRSGPMKIKSWCKSCSWEAHREWRENRPA